jgi:hypothetical protein
MEQLKNVLKSKYLYQTIDNEIQMKNVANIEEHQSKILDFDSVKFKNQTKINNSDLLKIYY